MSKKLNQADYREHLKEQICFLQASAKNYDNGVEFEAKRMALIIRVLIWDSTGGKGRSTSLLGQLKLKKTMDFISTAQPFQRNNLLTQQCLVKMHSSNEGGIFEPLFDDCCAKKMSCRDWANEIIMSDKSGHTYRRIDLIKLLADKDGGAHVDVQIDDDLSALKDKYVSGWHQIDATGNESPLNNDVVYCSMRQIAYEMLQSLYAIKPKLFFECYF